MQAAVRGNVRQFEVLFHDFPIGSMGLVYLPTSDWFVSWLSVNIPFMDGTGYD